MFRTLLVSTAALVLAFPAIAADKFDAKKLKGSWVREKDGNELVLEFKDDKNLTAHLKPAGLDKAAVCKCEISVDQKGKLKGKITSVEKNGFDGAPPEGTEFEFKIEVGEKTITLSEFKAGDGDGGKDLVEGEYKKKTD